MKEKVIFLGDSITEWGNWPVLFPGVNIINEGIAGNTTSDILNRIDCIHGADASKLFLLVGINDLALEIEIYKILDNYNLIVEQLMINFPELKIHLISTLPMKFGRFRQPMLSRENLDKLNEGIHGIAVKHGLIWIDMAPAFSDEKGSLVSQFTKDGLHLSQEGYLQYKDQLFDYLGQ